MDTFNCNDDTALLRILQFKLARATFKAHQDDMHLSSSSSSSSTPRLLSYKIVNKVNFTVEATSALTNTHHFIFRNARAHRKFSKLHCAFVIGLKIVRLQFITMMINDDECKRRKVNKWIPTKRGWTTATKAMRTWPIE